MNPYLKVIQVLNGTQVPYVIVGGFALVLHGVNRFTPDINIVVDFDHSAFSQAFHVLIQSGLEAEDPGLVSSVTDSSARARILEKEKKQFFSLRDPQTPNFRLDFCLFEPLPFRDLMDSAETRVVEGLPISICSTSDLIAMKQLANRGQDRDDISSLNLTLRVRSQLERGTSKEQILAEAKDKSEADRLKSLIEFQSISDKQRIDWLIDVLTEIGRFCIL